MAGVLIYQKPKDENKRWTEQYIPNFTDYGILERHTQLDSTLGLLDMEVKSYERARLFSWIFFPSWIGLTAIQAFCYIMYNDKFHPLAKILGNSNQNNLSYLQFARWRIIYVWNKVLNTYCKIPKTCSFG